MRRLPLRPVPLQAAIAVLALVAMVLSPPASGAMLLIPTDTDGGAVARAALATGALLLGSGPVAGSLVVVGQRSRIAGRIGLRHVLILAAPPAGCTGWPVRRIA